MKTRMTFRLSDDLAITLRHLANQTHFVEQALRNALGISCPMCDGSGKILGERLHVSNIKTIGISKLSRTEGLYLKQLVRLARNLAASKLHLSKPKSRDHVLDFLLTRNDAVLFGGTLNEQGTRFGIN